MWSLKSERLPRTTTKKRLDATASQIIRPWSAAAMRIAAAVFRSGEYGSARGNHRQGPSVAQCGPRTGEIADGHAKVHPHLLGVPPHLHRDDGSRSRQGRALCR